MHLVRTILIATLFMTPVTLVAQGNPVSDAVRESAGDNGKNLLAAAAAMPAEKYGYKPTPAQMTFGQLIVHIQGDNRITCAAIGGNPPAAEPALSAADVKDKLVAALERSLDFCAAALATTSDSQLGAIVPYYGHNAPRASAMIGLVTDWANHYGQQAMYLRLNGILPPTAR
ncbi:MAG TPA: DinB family protein [Gemmatimonadales bacterium]|nr:DinB family protein [Gemmatimonadales bacterium]